MDYDKKSDRVQVRRCGRPAMYGFLMMAVVLVTMSGGCQQSREVVIPSDESAGEIRLISSGGPMVKKGIKAAANKQYERALAWFVKAADARPENHAALYNAGVMCEVIGDMYRARRFYRRAMDIQNIKIYAESYYNTFP